MVTLQYGGSFSAGINEELGLCLSGSHPDICLPVWLGAWVLFSYL